MTDELRPREHDGLQDQTHASPHHRRRGAANCLPGNLQQVDGVVSVDPS
jgi:hypothetical protein